MAKQNTVGQTVKTTKEQTADKVAAAKKVQRRPSVSRQAVAKAIALGAKAGKTTDEVAAELGMAVQSFRTRMSTVKEYYRNKGIDLGTLKRKNGVKKEDDFIAELQEMIGVETTDETDADETAADETAAE